MVNKAQLAAALKAVPGTRGSIAPQSSGYGRISPIQSEMYMNNPYRDTYGPFLPRQPEAFSDGAFGPMPPIQPVPVDQPPFGGQYPDPRWWQYTQGWNLPTPPGSEGLKLASFDQLKVLSEKYSVARACIELRIDEILGLGWEIGLTKQAAKAYQGDHSANRDAGERMGKLTKFFLHPDPEYTTFDHFLHACLEEVFVYDALALIMRPKFGEQFGMGGRGLLGSQLDSLRLVSGPTIRPLLDLHGGKPKPPNPAYQQFLYGVPRSDYETVINGTDIDDYGLSGAEYNSWDVDIMRYEPLWNRRESPYGFPPVERALLPIISGLQKQEYQLDYFTEGSVPAVYISPGDNNITATQVKELQDALNGIAGDKAFHMKVVVLPPGSKVEPQRPVDLSDGFDELVMMQVCMAFDVQPIELGILPNVGGGGQQGPSASAIRLGSQEARDIKSRKSTKPLLHYLANIFNYIIQDVCECPDLQFQFEGLADDEDKQAITELGVQQVQNGIASIDEVRDRLDLAPWGMKETSGPVVFTAQGPVPFDMAPQLIMAAQGGGQQQGGGSGGNNRTQGTNGGQRSPSSRSTSKQPAVRQGGQTKPNGSHPAPLSPHRESLTPAHSAASGAIQSSTPRTGGTTSRSSVAGSRKKAVEAELSSLGRHLRKGRDISTWNPEHITWGTVENVVKFIADGYLTDVALRKAGELHLAQFDGTEDELTVKVEQDLPMWPGWEHDQRIVETYKGLVADAFKAADVTATDLRKRAASGAMFVNGPTLRGLISDGIHDTFMEVLKPLWYEAYSAGYASAKYLVTGETPDFTELKKGPNVQAFIDSEGQHWLDEISMTGMKDQAARIPTIARTEVARAMNAGAIQAYRDNKVQMKHLLLAPDDTCDVCKSAELEGDIPLDAIFPSGGLGGPFHPNCRCVPAPAGLDLVPPQASKSVEITEEWTTQHTRQLITGEVEIPRGPLKESWEEDPSRAAFLMMRANHPETGKTHYLLQQRSDGHWGMPGGTAHVGEHPLASAVRESTEEIGDLPLVQPSAYLMHQDEDKTIHIFVCDVPWFTPKLNGSTPEETQGAAWFRKKDIKNLKLHPKFKDQWSSIDWDGVNKRQIVTENGEQLTASDSGQPLFPAGARWPYPRRSDGAEDPHYGTNYVPEPPSGLPAGAREYDGGEDPAKFPKRRTRNQGPKSQVNQSGKLPSDTDGGTDGGPSGGRMDVGSRTGVLPTAGKTVGAPVPVVGMKPPMAPKPGSPKAIPPEVFDPGENVEQWSDQDESNVVFPQPKKKNDARLAALKRQREELIARRTGPDCGSPYLEAEISRVDADIYRIEGVPIQFVDKTNSGRVLPEGPAKDVALADPKKPGGPSDYSDPNPVDPEHVMNMMRSNFPEKAIEWVMRARWIGPINIPWERIDDNDIEGWAASHQPEAISRFAKDIKAGTGHTNPSVCIQDNDTNEAIIIDGHHRALAHKKLGQPILAYLGMIDPADRKAAEETHSLQVHSGADPRNK